jgi:micrococcal nuclease
MGNELTSLCLHPYLSSRNELNTKEYSFTGEIFLGKIISVYDGDTCTAIVRIHQQYQQIKIRCYGYDSPEIKPKKDCINREEIIQKANEAKEMLSRLCLNQIVRIEIHGFDKYGRFLGTIYKWEWFQRININQLMVERGYGYPYDGGKKLPNGL